LRAITAENHLSRLTETLKQVSHNDSLETASFFGHLLEEELIYEQSPIEGEQKP
jgi:hypothetical protein